MEALYDRHLQNGPVLVIKFLDKLLLLLAKSSQFKVLKANVLLQHMEVCPRQRVFKFLQMQFLKARRHIKQRQEILPKLSNCLISNSADPCKLAWSHLKNTIKLLV